MKRNNIFMWAYISFIFAGILYRLHTNYANWKPLVLAITVSTIFFAFEDLFTSLGKTSGDLCDITKPIISELQEKSEKDADSLNSIMDGYFIEAVNNDTYEYYLRPEADLGEITRIISRFERDLQRRQRAQKWCQKIAYFFTFLGCFFLFSTFIIANLITISAMIQDIITTFSFAIVLITRQIDNARSRKIEGKIKVYQKILEKIIGKAV